MAKLKAEDLKFTMAEYIERNDLEADPHNPAMCKVIADHLKELGYIRRKVRGEDGEVRVYWMKDDYDKRVLKLKQQLARLEGRA